MMAQRVRVGVIGTSWWTDGVHLPCLSSHPAADIVALCGRRQEHAAAIATQFGIPEVYADYREMLATARLDAVVVVAPDDLHYEMVMAALDRGLHVLCEKPLALTAQQARTMYERAERAGVVHMTYFTFRWLPEHRYLPRAVDGGVCGPALPLSLPPVDRLWPQPRVQLAAGPPPRERPVGRPGQPSHRPRALARR